MSSGGKPGSQPGRGVRGVRHSAPGGTLIGRRSDGGVGAVEFVTFQQLQQALIALGGTSTGATFPSSVLVTPQFVHQTGIAILFTGVPTVVCSVSLSAGAWDLSGSVTFDPNGAVASSFSDAIVAISQNPAVLPAPPNNGGYVEYTQGMSITGPTTLTTAVMRLVLPAPGTVWLLAQATFS